MLDGLDLQDMAKMLDRWLLHRRDAVPSDLGAAFRGFLLGTERGLQNVVCKY